MLLSFSYIALLSQLAVAPNVDRAAAPKTVPFDTTVAVSNFSGVAINLASGGKVRIVESTPENFKVTTPHDLKVAALLLGERRV